MSASQLVRYPLAVLVSSALILVGCNDSGSQTKDSTESFAKAREKYEPAVLGHARSYADEISAAAIAKWKELPPTASFTEASAKAEQVAAEHEAQARETGEAICNDVNSAFKAAKLDVALSEESRHASETVKDGVAGSLSEAVVRSVLGLEAQSRDQLLVLLGIGLPSDPASRYSEGVKVGVISQSGTLTAAPPLSDDYKTFSTWLANTPRLVELMGILEGRSFRVIRACMTYLP